MNSFRYEIVSVGPLGYERTHGIFSSVKAAFEVKAELEKRRKGLTEVIFVRGLCTSSGSSTVSPVVYCYYCGDEPEEGKTTCRAHNQDPKCERCEENPAKYLKLCEACHREQEQVLDEQRAGAQRREEDRGWLWFD